ncbi:FUSC family protein [Achromobacter aloeverae]|uniref:FUSC family protein n=2 Tax=Achromobacter aloeverae TaxID=1750518 RepID=A0A4Q1HFV1_9BURK|nr:FUSC family protein [Achromobacter aloeverae]
MLAQASRAALASLGRELRAWRPSRERAMFGIEALLSVALAVAAAHALQLTHTWWAALSGFAVMQANFSASLQRAAYRIVGTVAGAAIGTLAGPWTGDAPWLFVPAMAVIGAVTVYNVNASRWAYAWMLGGITALMVMCEARTGPGLQLTAEFATLRVAEVVVGTLACVLVATLFHWGAKAYSEYRISVEIAPAGTAGTGPGPVAEARAEASAKSGAEAGVEAGWAVSPDTAATATTAGRWTPTADGKAPADPPADPPATATPPALRRLLAMQAALAIALIAASVQFLQLPGYEQAMVTAIAVLMLPAGQHPDTVHKPMLEKMTQRAIGCLLAGIIGVAMLPLMRGHAVLCLMALAAGVWAGCHVQTGKEGASYVGRQFAIAFLMVFVQDQLWSADPMPALLRLAGIFAGMAALLAAVLATSAFRFARDPSPPG